MQQSEMHSQQNLTSRGRKGPENQRDLLARDEFLCAPPPGTLDAFVWPKMETRAQFLSLDCRDSNVELCWSARLNSQTQFFQQKSIWNRRKRDLCTYQMTPNTAAGPSCTISSAEDGFCPCPPGYSGDECISEHLRSSTLLMVHTLIYCVLFVMTMGWAILNCIASIRLRHLSAKGRFTEIPTIILFLVICLGSFGRVFSLSIDPYGIYAIFPDVMETLVSGFIMWSQLSSAILIFVIWSETYATWNPESKTSCMRPIALASLTLLLVASLVTQLMFKNLNITFQNVFFVVITLVLVVFGFGFLWRSAALVRALRIDNVNTRKAILLRKIQEIAKTSFSIFIVLMILRVIATIFEWTFGSVQNFIIFQSLYRALEVTSFVCTLFLFGTHDHYELAFCSDRSRAVHFRLPSESRSFGSRSRSRRTKDDSNDDGLYDLDDQDDESYDVDEMDYPSPVGTPRSDEWNDEFNGSSQSIEADSPRLSDSAEP